MNKKQREELGKIKDKITEMEEIEREKYDNCPESLQDTDRVAQFEEYADKLQEISDLIDEIIEG